MPNLLLYLFLFFYNFENFENCVTTCPISGWLTQCVVFVVTKHINGILAGNFNIQMQFDTANIEYTYWFSHHVTVVDMQLYKIIQKNKFTLFRSDFLNFNFQKNYC